MRPLLDNISDGLKTTIFDAGRKKSYGEGEVIFERGQTADNLPLIISGSVKMIRMPKVGREVIIGIFRKGDVFAIPPLIDGGTYPSTAVAMEKTELLRIRRDKFLSMLESSPELSLNIIRWTCDMLRDKTSTIRTLATASPEVRVARTLLKIAENRQQELPIKVELRRQDIAEMTGLTTETTIRVIRKLAAGNILRIEHGKIFIDETDSLSRCAAN